MKKTLLLTTLILLTILTACHKDQPEINNTPTDPCSFAKEVSADFTMEEYGWNSKRLSETDTMYSGMNLLFTALDSNAEYTWYIGAEVITDRSFYRNFGSSLIGQTLPMHLVVKKDPNLICLPNDDGYDSITKYITIIDPGDPNQFYIDTNYRIEGLYRMKDINCIDSVDITIDIVNNYLYQASGFNWYQIFVFKNLDGQNIEIPFRRNGTTYRQFWFEQNGLGFNNDCYLRLNSPSNIEIKLGAHVGYPSYHFFGRKLN